MSCICDVPDFDERLGIDIKPTCKNCGEVVILKGETGESVQGQTGVTGPDGNDVTGPDGDEGLDGETATLNTYTSEIDGERSVIRVII